MSLPTSVVETATRQARQTPGVWVHVIQRPYPASDIRLASFERKLTGYCKGTPGIDLWIRYRRPIYPLSA